MSIEPATPAPPPAPADDDALAMDEHAKLLAQYDECKEMIDFWEKRKDLLYAQIAKIMGSFQVGTVNGSQAVSYAPEQRFNGSAFKKAYPDMYKLYCREMTKEQLDVEWLKRSQPGIYEQFQVRPLKVTYKAPGGRN